MPHIRVTNIDLDPSKRAESNWLYGVLEGFNRKAIEVTEWIVPIPIVDSSGYGVYVQNAGDYTVFRKSKTTGLTNYLNHTVDCQVSQNIIFTTSLILPPQDGFNFSVAIQLIELGGNLLTDFEYGISNNENQNPANWQVSNIFNLIDEGVYYFDVRKIGTNQTIGKQSIELYLNQLDVPTTGGEDGDNPMPGDNSGE